MEVICTNFDGDWNEHCQYCKEPHHSHQVDVGLVEGIRYVHYQPCNEQLSHVGVEFRAPRGFLSRLVHGVPGGINARRKQSPQ